MIRTGQLGPISLRVSVTDLCQLRCLYCMQPGGAGKVDHDDVLRFEEITRIVNVLAANVGLAKVHLTGGEPLVRRGVVDLVAMLARRNAPDLALTTNGHLLSELAGPLAAAGLRRVNISLDSLNPATYSRLTRGSELGETLTGLDAAIDCGLQPVKINTTVLRGVNSDELVRIATFALQRGCEIRFLELMPIGPAAASFEDWFVSSDEVLAALGERFELTPLPDIPGASARRFSARGAADGVIGLVSPCTRPFCSDCRRLRLTATGQLIGCLGVGTGPNVRKLLRSGGSNEQLRAAVEQTQCVKRNGQTFTTPNLMTKTGG